MSNFICSECGMTNIDCGGAGYKTPKEIELENKIADQNKTIERLQEQIKKLKQYRDRAHKALCEISALSEKEMDGGKAWDIARDAILCLNEIKE